MSLKNKGFLNEIFEQRTILFELIFVAIIMGLSIEIIASSLIDIIKMNSISQLWSGTILLIMRIKGWKQPLKIVEIKKMQSRVLYLEYGLLQTNSTLLLHLWVL